ncbi:MAG: hypothetical protein LBG15_08365 [Dysgonamonadaceae bacterium]|jgi:hypothetical protein|nr:hypothetical protein [Dysgonamonadaceae bacterium]
MMNITKTIARSLLLVACFILFSCEADKQPVALETFQFAGSDTPIDALDVGEIQAVVVTPFRKSPASTRLRDGLQPCRPVLPSLQLRQSTA